MANRFVGLKLTSKAKFMGEEIDIGKLSVTQVINIQNLSKEFEATNDPLGNLKVLCTVIKAGAAELRDLTEEELNDFPVEELTKLSEAIMQYSGLAGPK